MTHRIAEVGLWIWIVVAVVAGDADAQRGGPTKVSVTPIVRHVFHPQVEVLGRIEAVKDTVLGAEVPGLVVEVLVDEGSQVEAGEVVARLDTSLREIRKRRAEAELALAREQLREFNAGSRAEDIREAEAMLEDATAQLEEAIVDRKRIEALEGTDAVSEDEVSSARAAERSRAAVQMQRQALLDRLRKGPRAEVIARAESEVAVREANLAEIVDEIGKATIRAPFAGVITEKEVDVGRYVTAGGDLFGLVQTNPVRAVLIVAEGDLRDVAVGQTAMIETAASAGNAYKGTIQAIIPRGDPVARTFPVKVLLGNEQQRILPGMGVRARILTTTTVPRLAVPTDAIAESPVGRVVFVVRDGKARRVPVRTGISEAGLVEITGDVREGEPVVVLGNETLRPDSDVLVVPRSVPVGGGGNTP